ERGTVLGKDASRLLLGRLGNPTVGGRSEVRIRGVLLTIVVVGLALGAAALAARHFWPSPTLASSSSALVRLSVPHHAGTATVRVSTPSGASVPIRLKQGLVCPRRVRPSRPPLVPPLTVP